MMKIFVQVFYIVLISASFLIATYFPTYLKKTDPKTLNIFVWGDFFPEKTFLKFEQETGIRVQVNYYVSNEELILKLEKTKGMGYDIIFPSDYAVKILKEKDLLQPIDHTKLTFKEHIEPSLLNQYFDPNNTFSFPYFWEVYGMALEKNLYPKGCFPSLALLFEKTNRKVVMTADPVEAITFATHYLYGKKKTALFCRKKGGALPFKKTKKASRSLYRPPSATDYLCKSAPYSYFKKLFLF